MKYNLRMFFQITIWSVNKYYYSLKKKKASFDYY